MQSSFVIICEKCSKPVYQTTEQSGNTEADSLAITPCLHCYHYSCLKEMHNNAVMKYSKKYPLIFCRRSGCTKTARFEQISRIYPTLRTVDPDFRIPAFTALQKEVQESRDRIGQLERTVAQLNNNRNLSPMILPPVQQLQPVQSMILPPVQQPYQPQPVQQTPPFKTFDTIKIIKDESSSSYSAVAAKPANGSLPFFTTNAAFCQTPKANMDLGKNRSPIPKSEQNVYTPNSVFPPVITSSSPVHQPQPVQKTPPSKTFGTFEVMRDELSFAQLLAAAAKPASNQSTKFFTTNASFCPTPKAMTLSKDFGQWPKPKAVYVPKDAGQWRNPKAVELPKNLGQMSKLKAMELSKDFSQMLKPKATELSKDFGQLSKPKSMDHPKDFGQMSKPKAMELAKDFGHISNLKAADPPKNPISQMPIKSQHSVTTQNVSPTFRPPPWTIAKPRAPVHQFNSKLLRSSLLEINQTPPPPNPIGKQREAQTYAEIDCGNQEKKEAGNESYLRKEPNGFGKDLSKEYDDFWRQVQEMSAEMRKETKNLKRPPLFKPAADLAPVVKRPKKDLEDELTIRPSRHETDSTISNKPFHPLNNSYNFSNKSEMMSTTSKISPVKTRTSPEIICETEHKAEIPMRYEATSGTSRQQTIISEQDEIISIGDSDETEEEIELIDKEAEHWAEEELLKLKERCRRSARS